MKLEARLLVPMLGAAAAVMLIVALAPWPWGLLSARTAALLAAAGAALSVLACAALMLRWRILRPLQCMAMTSTVVLAPESGRAVTTAPDVLAAMETGMRALIASVAEGRSSLESVQRALAQAEEALRQSEMRYTVAVGSSSDGMWEWTIDKGTIMLTPRWQGMLGHPADWQPDWDSWRATIRAEDRASFDATLGAHLDGRTESFVHQRRVRHRDGSERWLYARGTAVRHASGKPYRVICLDTDVTALKRVETVLREIVEGTSGATGEAFFRAMVRHFAGALQVPVAFVTECLDQPVTRLRTLAFWSDGGYGENFEYSLAGTPCETVVGEGTTCFYPDGVGREFPAEAGFEGYLGIPIFAGDGRVIGHLAFLDRKSLGDEMLVDAVYRVFTARTAAELEKRAYAAEIERLRAC